MPFESNFGTFNDFEIYPFPFVKISSPKSHWSCQKLSMMSKTRGANAMDLLNQFWSFKFPLGIYELFRLNSYFGTNFTTVVKLSIIYTCHSVRCGIARKRCKECKLPVGMYLCSNHCKEWSVIDHVYITLVIEPPRVSLSFKDLP